MTIEQKITTREAKVGVIGLGYVGLPLSGVFAHAGFHVLGFDVDPAKISDLAEGRDYLQHLGPGYAKTLKETGRFEATADFTRLAEADAILICVPTPLDRHLEPDLSYVEQTADDVAAALRPGQLVVLESTTYPGTTREVVLPRLESTGLKLGVDFYLAFSPEREDPGRKSHSTRTIPKLVGGVDEQSGRLATALYGAAFASAVPVSSAEVAEASKLLENIYRAVNIALVNEMKVVLEGHGHRCLGSDRRRRHEAFRLPAVLSRSGIGRALHTDRSFLSHLEGTRSRSVDAIHRTGRSGESRHARVCGATHHAGAQWSGQGRQGIARACVGSCLQSRCG